MEAEKLTLGGREYGYVGVGPLRQDLWVMMHARHAGLAGAEIMPGESPEDFARRLLDMLLMSKHPLLLLGGLLLPAGKRPEDWTEEMARDTAIHLGGIMDPAEKERVKVELLSVMIAFFENGLASWIATARASAVANEGPGTSPPSVGENGTDWSASSEITIPNGASGSPAG